MNPFNLPINVLEGVTAPGQVIAGPVTNLLSKARYIIEQAQHQAADLLHRTERDALAIQQAAARLGESRKAMVVQSVINETRDATIAQTLTWLVDEKALEATLAENMVSRIRETMFAVLTPWFDNQDHAVLLAKRLADIIRQRAQKYPCTLRLHAADLETVVAQLGQQADLREIPCTADPALAAGQAVIESEFLRIEFDLDRHWETVLATLGKMHPVADIQTDHGNH